MSDRTKLWLARIGVLLMVGWWILAYLDALGLYELGLGPR